MTTLSTSFASSVFAFLNNADNLHMTSGGSCVPVHVNLNAGLIWFYSFATGQYNGQSITLQNPATNTGGYPLTTIQAGGAVYITFSGESSNASAFLNAGQLPFVRTPATGYSAAGSSVRFDPANIGAYVTLSNSNQVATTNILASQWFSAKSNTTFTSGLIYFEMCFLSKGLVQGIMVGVGNAAASNANYIGSDTNGISYWPVNGDVFYNGSVLATIGPYVVGNVITNIGTTSKTTGQKFAFEVTASAMAASSLQVGITGGTLPNNDYLGGDLSGQSIGSFWGANAVNFANATVGQSGNPTIPSTQMIVGNLNPSVNKFWQYNPVTGLWLNGSLATQNPATNTGGLSLATLMTNVGNVVYAGITIYTGSFAFADQLIVNFGATLFSNTLPAGYPPWDAGPNSPKTTYQFFMAG